MTQNKRSKIEEKLKPNKLQWLREKETWHNIITFYVTDKSRQSQEKKCKEKWAGARGGMMRG